MELGEVPRHLVVVGGGYIGLEFGQLFRRLGSAVTIVQSGPRLLTREDDDVADEVRKILEQDGIEMLLNASAQSVRAGREGCADSRGRRRRTRGLGLAFVAGGGADSEYRQAESCGGGR